MIGTLEVGLGETGQPMRLLVGMQGRFIPQCVWINDDDHGDDDNSNDNDDSNEDYDDNDDEDDDNGNEKKTFKTGLKRSTNNPQTVRNQS